MHSFSTRRVLWALFALLLAVGGYVSLSACDLGFRPLFGLRYCEASSPPSGLAEERARQRGLLARLQEAELRAAEKPFCAPPVKPKPPIPPSENDQHEGDVPPHGEPMRIPERKQQLEGCWQSERGDIQFYRDDETHAPTGRARICYCFDKNGRGTVRQTFSQGEEAGSICETRLRAQLQPDMLLLEHPQIPCTKGSNVNGATIRCVNSPDGSATCVAVYKARVPLPPLTEKFNRVPNEYCGYARRR